MAKKKKTSAAQKRAPKKQGKRKPKLIDPRNPNWDPNRTTFEEGQAHLKKMLAEAKLDPDAQILTSKDPRSKKLKKLLETSNVPPGFKKYQLPFSFHKPSNQYMTVGKANAEVKSHAHEDGAGLRVVLEGSITYQGKVLKKGDWMYIPAGTAYAYRVGPKGVSLFASYQC